jgi:hypothetical protein
MTRLAAIVRWLNDREPVPSMVMVDAQTVKGARYGPTFHEAGGRGGRAIGTKRTDERDLHPLARAHRAGSRNSLAVSPRERSKWPAPARRSQGTWR